jgi:GT2 family glycosyltransferase
MRARLAIVIVNWNSGEQLRECLASIPLATAPLADIDVETEVVVVDNASGDDSAQHLQAADLPVHVVCNTVNRGFAAACNQGAQTRSADLILFLNPDTRLFADSLRPAIDFLRAPGQHDVGIVGIQLLDDRGVARSCSRFPSAWRFLAQAFALDRAWPALGHAMREWDHESTRSVDQVIGAYFLVRREVYEALRGFDERFFVYYEEVDFARRAKAQGWRSVYFAGAKAYHRGGGTSSQVKGRRLYYNLRSRLAYGAKHFGPVQRALLAAVTWGLEPWTRRTQLLLQRRFDELQHLSEGYRLLRQDPLREAV